MKRHRLTGKQREELYDRCRGANEFPFCNLCTLPVTTGQAWDESHVGAPAALGGTDTGVAHRKCNRLHGAKVVTPFVAKTKRMRRRHIGAHTPSYRPLPGGRDSDVKLRINDRPVDRVTGEPWRGWR